MPAISREQIGFNGEQVIRVVNCNSAGEFSIRLPPILVERLGCNSIVEGPSKEDVICKWDEKIAEYIKSAKSSKKVICYKVQTVENISFSEGVVLGISAGVFMQETITYTNKKNVRYTEVESDIPTSAGISTHDLLYHEHKVIDWSDEAEGFFATLCINLQDLIDKLEKYTKDEKAVMNFIASNGPALLPSGEQK